MASFPFELQAKKESIQALIWRTNQITEAEADKIDSKNDPVSCPKKYSSDVKIMTDIPKSIADSKKENYYSLDEGSKRKTKASDSNCRIDKLARWIFPIMYFIFLLSYGITISILRNADK